MKRLHTFWADEAGFVLSAELVIIATVVVLGLITGLKCIQTALVGEMKDVAGAIGSLNQSYYYTGMHGCWSPGCGIKSFTRGSAFFDQQDVVTTTPCDFGFSSYQSGVGFSGPAFYSQGATFEAPLSGGCGEQPCGPTAEPGCLSGCDEGQPSTEQQPPSQAPAAPPEPGASLTPDA